MNTNLPKALIMLLCALNALLFSIPLYAQTGKGSIIGVVKTTDGKLAGDVTVMLKGTNKAVTTEEDGTFIFHDVPAGNYELQVSLTGYETVSQAVKVESNQVATVNLTLKLSGQQLQEVVINARKNKFAKKESDYVARLPIKNMENPQVYNVITKDLIKEQVITDIGDVFRNIPGGLAIKAGGGSVGIVSRGFSTYANLRNGMNTAGIGPEDPINIERVEAIKGPSGTLFGNVKTSYGGLLNYVTKKPFDDFKGEVSYTAGSWELNRLTADINTPLNKDKTLLLRTTAAMQSENSFQDQGFSKSYNFSPKLTYKLNERLTLNLDVEILRQKWNAPATSWTIGSAVTAKGFKDIKLGYDRNLLSNSVYNQNGLNNVFAQANYKLSDKWISQTSYTYSEGYYDNFNYVTFNWLTDSTVARQIGIFRPDMFGNITFQQNFIGDVKVAGLRNRIVAGVDYSRDYWRLNRTSYTNTYDTVNVNHNISNVSGAALDQWTAAKTWTATKYTRNIYSMYVSDLINLTDNLMAMLSLRLDRNETSGSYNPTTNITSGKFGQTTLSPKLGLVYQPVKDVISIFGNYMNGFQNLAPAAQAPNGEVASLKPQRADQWEGGVKLNAFNGKLSSTFSYYNINVTNSTYADPTNSAFTIQDGTQRSKGFEAEVIANPIPGLNITAGYGYNENKYTKASAALQGKYATWAPKSIANLWISYKLVNGPQKGWGIAAGGNYAGDSWYNASNTFILPGYTLLNAVVFYDQSRFNLSFKLNNLLGEKYWNTNGNPQKPFNIAASVSYKF